MTEIIAEKYIVQKAIGEGSYGVVKLAVHKDTNQEVAIKNISKKDLDESQLERLHVEYTAMKELSHPNIVKLVEVIENTTNLIIVMAFAKGGDLLEYVKTKGRLGEEEARRIFGQLVSAVEYAHKKRYIHRDLKLENIFLDDKKNVVVGDWGFAGKWAPGHFLDNSFGSIHYASPEICSGKPYSGPEVDIWSCGVILYIMVTGSMPFSGPTEWKIYHEILQGRYSVPSHVSVECFSLFKKILEGDRLRRATTNEIKNHAWMDDRLASPVPPREPYPEVPQPTAPETPQEDLSGTLPTKRLSRFAMPGGKKKFSISNLIGKLAPSSKNQRNSSGGTLQTRKLRSSSDAVSPRGRRPSDATQPPVGFMEPLKLTLHPIAED